MAGLGHLVDGEEVKQDVSSSMGNKVVKDKKGASGPGKERPAGALGLEALLVALKPDERCPRWYVPVKQLQLVSVAVCAACRKCSTSHVFVTPSTPRLFWLRHEHHRYLAKRGHSRVPAWRVSSIMWEMSPAVISGRSKLFKAGLRQRLLRRQTVDRAWWPSSLRALSFDRWFNDDITDVLWPDCLERLEFGYNFNQPVAQVDWPDSLRALTFSGYFNQPVHQTPWPHALELLTFGTFFNRPIAHVVWPDSLRVLTFGECFDQPVDDVMWPPALELLTFGRDFDQEVDDAEWPAALRRLTLGKKFKRSVVLVKRRGVEVYKVFTGWRTDELRKL